MRQAPPTSRQGKRDIYAHHVSLAETVLEIISWSVWRALVLERRLSSRRQKPVVRFTLPARSRPITLITSESERRLKTIF